jgi:hypothetical protein
VATSVAKLTRTWRTPFTDTSERLTVLAHAPQIIPSMRRRVAYVGAADCSTSGCVVLSIGIDDSPNGGEGIVRGLPFGRSSDRIWRSDVVAVQIHHERGRGNQIVLDCSLRHAVIFSRLRL